MIHQLELSNPHGNLAAREKAFPAVWKVFLGMLLHSPFTWKPRLEILDFSFLKKFKNQGFGMNYPTSPKYPNNPAHPKKTGASCHRKEIFLAFSKFYPLHTPRIIPKFLIFPWIPTREAAPLSQLGQK